MKGASVLFAAALLVTEAAAVEDTLEQRSKLARYAMVSEARD